MVKRARSLRVMVIFLAFITVLSLVARAQQPVQKDGYALLASLDQIFELSVRGPWEIQKVDQIIAGLLDQARQAREKGLIDKLFFARYHRLLGIMKLTAEPDPNKILAPVIDRVVGDFVRDVLAEEFDPSRPDKIQLLATAIRNEIIELQLYLDNQEKRQRLLNEWETRIKNIR